MSSAEFPNSLAFVILSPEPNIARLRDTVRSIKNSFGDDFALACCVGKDIKRPQLDEMCEVCPSFKGGNTVTSLINQGFEKINREGWRIFVMEGARVPRSLISRYSRWVRSDRDVLFPIVVNHDRDGNPSTILSSFEDCTLNGMLIHSRLFQESGKFSDNPLAVSKAFWAFEAASKGAIFKAILGVKII